MIQVKKTYYSDLLGASASLLCLIHCTITPLIFLAKPILDGATHAHEGPSIWGMLDWVFLMLSLVAVWYSARHTPSKRISLLLWGFWVIFVAGLLFEMGGFEQLKWLMYGGSIALAITHGVNYQHCKRCENDQCD